MKNTLKKFLLVFCVLTMTLSLTACGGADKSIKYDEATLIPLIQQYVTTSLPMMSVEAIEQQEMQLDEATYAMYHKTAESYEQAKEEIGDISEVTNVALSSDEKNITAIASVVGTTGKTAEVEIIMDKRMSLSSITVNVNRTFAENMKNAGLNTILGMGTVFVVLILIAFIISCFKYIAVIEKKMKEKKEAPVKSAEAVDNAVAQIIETEAQSDADDLELVAVISAAIAAYEEAAGNSGDGYVVRSIRRRA